VSTSSIWQLRKVLNGPKKLAHVKVLGSTPTAIFIQFITETALSKAHRGINSNVGHGCFAGVE